MLRAMVSFLIASEEPPGLEDRRARLSHLQASSSFSGPAGLGIDRCAADARKTSVIRWDAFNGEPDGVDPVYLRKTVLRFPRGHPRGFPLFGGDPMAPGGWGQVRSPHTD
jgi:hypothetical protein